MSVHSETAGIETGEARIAPFQRECINLFVHAAGALSIPRSVGEIYGLLFASERPLPMDSIIGQLNISKGSASQGLRWLRDVGAVRAEYVTGDRRDYFTAETELRKLVLGFLRETMQPRLDRGKDYLTRLDDTLKEIPKSDQREFAESRLKKLRRWQRFASQIFPLFLRVAGKF
ncbi:MAG TPA: hypothetical protein VNB29_09055 [Chthoniobacterales bacterium]|nr:hypothetical protein [Chthoniobacterales bacterium]